MLLTGYEMKLIRAAECKPGCAPLYCIAFLKEEISAVLPYLNSELGARGMRRDPPALLLDYERHQVAIEGERIEVSDVRDGDEARKVLDALVVTINDVWKRRERITPSLQAKKPAQALDVFRMLPGNNCAGCGEPTCMAFAVKLIRKESVIADCPEMSVEQLRKLGEYLMERG